MACATPSLAPDANWMIPSNFVLTPALRPQADPDYSPLIKSSTSEKPIDTQQQSDQSARHALPVNKTDASPSPFNIFHHFQSIFKLPHGPPYLRFLDGLRVLSMIWVHLGHAFIFYLGFLPGIHAHKNAESVRGSLSHHFVLGGTFAVDTFFFLSGLLAAYQVSKALRKLSSFKSRLAAVTAICLQRYVRLIGLVLFILFLTMAQNPESATDPFMKDVLAMGLDGQFGGCRKYWWTVPLLATNIVSEGSAECVQWLWYLSNDWQFFLFGMTILLLYTWNRRAGLITAIACLIISLSISLYVVGHYEFPASIDMADVSNTETFARDSREVILIMPEAPHSPFFFKFYIAPYIRVQVYIIGLLFGLYIAQKEREGQFITSTLFPSSPNSPVVTVTRLPNDSTVPYESLDLSRVPNFSLTRPTVTFDETVACSTAVASPDSSTSSLQKHSTTTSPLIQPSSAQTSPSAQEPSFHNLTSEDAEQTAQTGATLSTSSSMPTNNMSASSTAATSKRRGSRLALPSTTYTALRSSSDQMVKEISGPRLCERKFHWSWEIAVYIALVTLILLPYYANTRHSLWTPLVNLFYVAWSRCLWSISIAGLSYLAVSNNLILNHFLSLQVWIPLSKLSYAFYLMHPIVLSGIYASHRLHLPRLLSWDVFAFYFFMTLLLTLVVATLIYVFIETPLKLIGYRILKKCLSPLEKTVHQSKKVD